MTVTTTARPAIDLTEEEGAIQVPLPKASVDDLQRKDRQVEEDLRAHLGALGGSQTVVGNIDAIRMEAEIDDCWFDYKQTHLTQETPEEEDVDFVETDVPSATLPIIDSIDVTSTRAARRRQLTAMRHKRQRHKFEIEGLATLKEHRTERRLIRRTRKQARHLKRPQRRRVGHLLNALLERLRKHRSNSTTKIAQHINPRFRHLAPVAMTQAQESDQNHVTCDGTFVAASALENGEIVVVSVLENGEVDLRPVA